LINPNSISFFSQISSKLGGNASGERTVEDELKEAKKEIEAKNISSAAQIYSNVLKNELFKDFHSRATAGLAQCALMEKNFSLADELINSIKNNKEWKHQLTHPDIVSAISSVELHRTLSKDNENSNEMNEIKSLTSDITSNPNNLSARYKLSTLLLANSQHEQAINHLLFILRQNRNYNENGNDAKKLILMVINSLGSESVIAKNARKQLSNILI